MNFPSAIPNSFSIDPPLFSPASFDQSHVKKKRLRSPTLSSSESSSPPPVRVHQTKEVSPKIAEIAAVPLGLSPKKRSLVETENTGDLPNKSAKVVSDQVEEIEDISDSSEDVFPRTESIVSDYPFKNGVYSGPRVWGRPHGKGRWVNSKGLSYECTFNDGSIEGYCVVNRPDGSWVFKGEFKSNKRNGKGALQFDNGNIYVGNFLNGSFHGSGKIITFDGKLIIDGNFRLGKLHGKGVQIGSKGFSYAGTFVQGIRQGYFEIKRPDGTVVYQGQMRNNKLHGEGKRVVPDGREFHGTFVDNALIGKVKVMHAGIVVYRGNMEEYHTPVKKNWVSANGNICSGDTINGVLNGIVHITKPDGSLVFHGPFLNNFPEGEGTWILPWGFVYTGMFRNGVPQGYIGAPSNTLENALSENLIDF